MTNSMHVAFSSDRNYLEYAAVALASLLHFASRPVTVHFLHEELTEADFERLKALPSQTEWELKPVRIPEGRFRDWPAMRWSRAAWYRLMAPELFPELDRLIYLDCDLICLDDLAPLWDIPLDGRFLAAAAVKIAPEHKERLGLSAGTTCFNSGVLVLNLAEMRRRNTVAELSSLREKLAGQLKYPDQDLLNMLCSGDFVKLPVRWNMITSLYRTPPNPAICTEAEARAALAEPGIAHFTGSHKPWHVWRTIHHPYGPAWIRFARTLPLSAALKRKLFIKQCLGFDKLKAPAKKVPWDADILKKFTPDLRSVR